MIPDYSSPTRQVTGWPFYGACAWRLTWFQESASFAATELRIERNKMPFLFHWRNTVVNNISTWLARSVIVACWCSFRLGLDSWRWKPNRLLPEIPARNFARVALWDLFRHEVELHGLGFLLPRWPSNSFLHCMKIKSTLAFIAPIHLGKSPHWDTNLQRTWGPA